MTEKLDPLLPKIIKLLRMLGSCSEGEIVPTVHAIRQTLTGADSDMHELVDMLHAEAFLKQVVQMAYDKGVAVNAKPHQTPTLPVNDPRGVNGYSWTIIAQHFVDNLNRLTEWEQDFARSVADWVLGSHGTPSPKQAIIIRRIFLSRFAGKI